MVGGWGPAIRLHGVSPAGLAGALGERKAMEPSWLETRGARPLYLAFVFGLALGLLQVIKLYLRRQRLLRDLRPFPAPPTHWFHGHQKVDGGEGGEAAAGDATR